LQDAPVDVANYYHGELGPFGVFDEFGAPTKAYDALCAFNELVSAGGRVATEGAIPGKLAILAAFNTEQQRAAVLVSNFGHQADEIEVTLSGLKKDNCQVRLIDSDRSNFAVTKRQAVGLNSTLRVKLKAPALALVTFD